MEPIDRSSAAPATAEPAADSKPPPAEKTGTVVFQCHICEEPSGEICARCTRDACDNHVCERCQRCSDCCACDDESR